MTVPSRPSDYVALLAATVRSARRSRFWSDRLGDVTIRSVADFNRLPMTSVDEYRRQPFGSLIADVGGIDWIPGPLLGQSLNRAPMSEGSEEARVRIELMVEAVMSVLPTDLLNTSAVVVSTQASRYFGAELSAVFVRAGVPAHLVTETATDRIGQLLEAFAPDTVALLSPAIDPVDLPESVGGLITVGRRSRVEHLRLVDLFVQNELGILGVAIGSDRYRMNHHRFHFEESREGTLVATPYFSRVQPVIRLDTGHPMSVIH